MDLGLRDWTAEEDEFLIFQLNINEYGRNYKKAERSWTHVADCMNQQAPSAGIQRFFTEDIVRNRWQIYLKCRCQTIPADHELWISQEDELLL